MKKFKMFAIYKRSSPKIIEKYLSKKKKNFNCPLHGTHGEWWFTKGTGKQVNTYLLCKKCKNEYEKFLRKKNPLYFLIKSLKRRAKDYGRKVNITIKDLEDKIKFQNNRCFYTNILFDNNLNLPSVDRKNSKLGYTKSNIQLILYDVNRMKSNLGSTEFLKLCKLINKPLKNKGSLKLLKYASRLKLRKEYDKDRKLFLSGKKVLCYTHGFHRDWKFFNYRYSFLKIYCTKCGIPKRPRIFTDEANLEKLRRYKKGLKMYCKVHGYHKHFWTRKNIRKKGTNYYISCNKCSADFKRKKIFSTLLTNTKSNAKKGKVKFTINYDDIIELYIKQNGKCKLTNIVFDINNKPSIDRINSKLGYVKKNISLVTYKVNIIKSDFNMKRIKKLTSLISNNFK